ncbi:MAG TPA: HEAT repeat domain-containing protein, partial [Gemmataceae bacterium]|nr:HEAT repeat domain-containing protein [Gemmataceae bacterium]
DGRTLVRSATGMMHFDNAEPARLNPGAIEFWDVATHQKSRVIDTGDEKCHAVALSPDGRTLAAAVGEDVWLIDLTDPAAEQERIGAEAYALAFADDGKRLVTYTVYGVKVWDVRARRDLFTLGGSWASALGNVGRVAFTPSGYVLATESDGLRVYDGREFAAPAVTAVAAKKKLGAGLATGPKTDAPPDDRPDAVRIAVKQSVEAQKDDLGAALLHSVEALSADPDPGRQAVHRLRIALALQRHPKLRPVVPAGATEPIGFAADTVTDPPGTPNVSDPTEAWHAADLILISADGRRLASYNRVTTESRLQEAKAGGRSPWWVRVLDARTGRPVGPVIDLEQRVGDGRIELSPDGKKVAAIIHLPAAKKNDDEEGPSGPAVVRVWNAETGHRVGEDASVPFKSDKKAWLWFVAEGRILVATSEDDRSKTPAWDAETMKSLGLPEPFDRVFGWDHSPYIVTSKGDGPAVVWDARTMKPVAKPLERTGLVDAVVSPDGSVAVLAYSYWVEAWDTKTGEARHPRVLARGGVKALAVSPDGSRFAAGYQGPEFKHFVRVWDSRTGDAVSPPIELTDDPTDVRFLAGGTALLTVMKREARVWDARTGEPITPPWTGEGPSGEFGWASPIRYALVGHTLLCQRMPQTSQFDEWKFAPDHRPVEELKTLAEVLAGRQRAADGSLGAIPADELMALRRAAQAKSPGAFGTPVGRAEDLLAVRPDPRTAQLVGILGDAQQKVDRRISACERLAELKAVEAQAPLTTALRADGDARVRAAAARALATHTPLKPESVAGLVRSLQVEGNTRVRADAARALHGPAAKQVTGELVQVLQSDKAPEVRAGAAYALKDASADAPGVREALKAATDKAQPWQLRVDAAGSLAKLYPNDGDAVEVLAAAAGEAKGWPQYTAVRYLHELGPRAAPAVPALAKIVVAEKYQSHFINTNWYAVHALMRIGPAAKDAMPALIQCLGQDEAHPYWTTNNPQTRDNPFAYTLARIGKPAIPELLKVVREDKDPKRRRAAVMSLAYMGPAAAETIPELEKLLTALEQKEKTDNGDELLVTALKNALKWIQDPKAKSVDGLMKK